MTDSYTSKVIRWILALVFLLMFLLCAAFMVWSVNAYNSFSYTGKRKLSKQVVEGIAEYVASADMMKIGFLICIFALVHLSVVLYYSNF